MNNPYYVAMATDDKYAQHAGVCICSIFENNRDLDLAVFVFENGVSDDNKRKFSLLGEEYGQRVVMVPSSIDDFSGFPIGSYYSVATFFRLRLAEYLDESVDRVLYIDCDTIVCSDIRPLLDIDLGSYALAAVMDTPWQVQYSTKLLNIPPSSGYFNAGIMLIDMNLYRAKNVYARSLDIVRQHKNLPYPDQDILNILFSGEWKELPCEWNLLNGCFRRVYHDGSERSKKWSYGIENRKIIHFSASTKPWLGNCVHPLKSQYIKYLKLSPWSDYKIKLTFGQLRYVGEQKLRSMLNHGEYIKIK